MRAIASLLLASFLSACASTPTSVTLSVPEIQAVGFQFVDERPGNERIAARIEQGGAEILVLLGDDSISPPPATVMKSWLQSDIPNAVAKRTVRLKRFSVGISIGNAAAATPNDLATAAATRRSSPLTSAALGALLSTRTIKTIQVVLEIDVEGRRATGGAFVSGQQYISQSDIDRAVRVALESFSQQVLAATNDL